MKNTKIAASLLAVTMLLGLFAGCSKTSNISADRFVKACEKLDLKEYEDYLEKAPELSDAEDGYYMVADDKDTIEELTGDSLEAFLRLMDLNDDIDADDITSIAAAVKGKGLEELKDFTSFDDLKTDGAAAIQITLKNADFAEEIIDGVDDLLGIGGIRSKHLSNKEYYSSKKEGYIRLHVDLKSLAKVISEDDTAENEFRTMVGIDADDYFGSAKGDFAASIDVKGGNIFILLGYAVNSKATVYEDFLEAFGILNDPMKLPDNKAFYDDLADILPSLLKYIVKAGNAKVERTGNGQTVGISLPTKDLMRWVQDGENMRKDFKDKGYSVDLQFASNDVATQISQIENMINSGCKVLIVAPIDFPAVNQALEKAHQKGIPVIAYDRLFYDSEYVDYYVSFDDYQIGVMQAEYIINKLDLENAKGPFNIEFTTGDTSDFHAVYFYNGAMDVLRPYYNSGVIRFVSGQKDFSAAATEAWSTEKAQARAEDIITRFYSDGTNIDAWLCSNDSTALGVTNALAATYTGKYPVITGQDCNIANVKNIINGKQSMSVFRDTRILASQAVKMADQILTGQKVETNGTMTFNNGKLTIPSYLCLPVFADANNYKEILIKSGYYREDQLS